MIKRISVKTNNDYEKNNLCIICNNVREVILISNLDGTKLYASYSLYEGIYYYSNGILDKSEAFPLKTHEDLDKLKHLILNKLDIINFRKI
jgi:hypothetical protein